MRKVIFAETSGTCRAPMAEALLVDYFMHRPEAFEICSRGLVVLFEEPINQKAQAVLVSNGINMDDYCSRQLTAADVNDETVIYVMEKKEVAKAVKIIGEDRAEQVFVLNEAVGEELEIMDPYGLPIPSYGLLFESLSKTIRKLAIQLSSKGRLL